jgi:hypothetical protein
MNGRGHGNAAPSRNIRMFWTTSMTASARKTWKRVVNERPHCEALQLARRTASSGAINDGIRSCTLCGQHQWHCQHCHHGDSRVRFAHGGGCYTHGLDLGDATDKPHGGIFWAGRGCCQFQNPANKPQNEQDAARLAQSRYAAVKDGDVESDNAGVLC